MRTTLNLDDDVAISLERLRRTRRQSLSVIVNDLLRRGITVAERSGVAQRTRFETAVADSGRALVPDVDDIAAALEALEVDQAQ
ncbi:CopG family transcriptional regulator [bacterium]|nr:MAG: CopG family transcriptional regulator [bacterium]